MNKTELHVDEQAIELACKALFEYFQAPFFNKKGGENVQNFMDYMESLSAHTPPQKNIPTTDNLAEENQELAEKNQELQKQLADAKQQLATLQEQNKLNTNRLAEENRSLQKRLDSANRALADTEQNLQHCQHKRLKEQNALYEIQSFLDGLSPEMKNLMATYFPTDSVINFLVQCGQFQKINQLWTKCSEQISNKKQISDMSATLKYILNFFNQIAGDTPATLIQPVPGESYNSEIHIRLPGNNGNVIDSVLLPGLRNLGGKIQQKAVVTLR